MEISRKFLISVGRGRGGGGHKGQRRHFTNPDQLAHSQEKKEKERQWRVNISITLLCSIVLIFIYSILII